MNTQPTLAIFGNISPYLSQSIVCGYNLQIWIWTLGHYIRDFRDHDKQSWTRLGRLIV